MKLSGIWIRTNYWSMLAQRYHSSAGASTHDTGGTLWISVGGVVYVEIDRFSFMKIQGMLFLSGPKNCNKFWELRMENHCKDKMIICPLGRTALGRASCSSVFPRTQNVFSENLRKMFCWNINLRHFFQIMQGFANDYQEALLLGSFPVLTGERIKMECLHTCDFESLVCLKPWS